MKKTISEFNLGKAEIFPKKEYVAGSYATITYTYTAGHSIDYAGYIKLTFRNMDDFGTPQFDDPAAPNYCTVSTTGNSRIIPRWDRKGAERPSNKALYFQIRDEFVSTGDVITIIFGDTSDGSPGWKLPTYITGHFEFTTYVDPIATYIFKKLPKSPSIALVPGPAVRAVCTAPSELVVGEGFDVYLRLEDRWGNPVGDSVRFPQPAYKKPGIYTVAIQDNHTGLSAESNPINVFNKEPRYKKYWADFHGQSGETIGSKTIDEYFTFGRDIARLDILGHQGNDFQISDAFWKKINQVAREFYQPGNFVTFPGYEWSGNTPDGGDRNVFFTHEGGTIFRSSLEQVPENKSIYTPSYTADALFKNLRKQYDPEAFVFAHVGGRYADLNVHDEQLETIIEVHSVWGTFEWFLREALRRGYRVGFAANSDGHKCDPGAAYPGNSKFSTPGGLTCVLAEKLDRESVFKAIKARRCYASSNPRILLDLLLNYKDKSFMMGEIANVSGGDKAVLHVRIAGTAPIQRVDVFNGTDLITTMHPYKNDNLGRRYKITWNGARVKGQDRVLRWDGGLQVEKNTIEQALPINFWNPDYPLEIINNKKLKWNSFTTGTAKGVLLTMEKSARGRIHFETSAAILDIDLGKIGLKPLIWDLGFLEKSVRVDRLPDKLNPREFAFQLPISGLKDGDNPIFIRLVQEDGQKAWSSPVFLVK
ncbi:MAG: DUF3604 domain-containing protein [Anaerolineaceae bacterium]|nr:DUF3604 domain-containing protein [Anaerolineaceae bacterium]